MNKSWAFYPFSVPPLKRVPRCYIRHHWLLISAKLVTPGLNTFGLAWIWTCLITWHQCWSMRNWKIDRLKSVKIFTATATNFAFRIWSWCERCCVRDDRGHLPANRSHVSNSFDTKGDNICDPYLYNCTLTRKGVFSYTTYKFSRLNRTRAITSRRVTSRPREAAGRSSRLRLCRPWRLWTPGAGGATTRSRTTWPSGPPSTRPSRSSAGPTGRRASSMSEQVEAGVTRMTRAVGGAASRTRATGSPTDWCGILGTESGWRPLTCPRPLSPPTEHQVWHGSWISSGVTTLSTAGLPPSYRKYSRTILVESSQQPSSRPSYVSTICVQPQSRQSPHSSQGRHYFFFGFSW